MSRFKSEMIDCKGCPLVILPVTDREKSESIFLIS